MERVAGPTATEVSPNAWTAWCVIRDGGVWAAYRVRAKAGERASQDGVRRYPLTKQQAHRALLELADAGYVFRHGNFHFEARPSG